MGVCLGYHWLWYFGCVGCKGLLWATTCLVAAAGMSNITFRKARESIAGNALHILCNYLYQTWNSGKPKSLLCTLRGAYCLICYFIRKQCCWKIIVLLLRCSMAIYVGGYRRCSLIRENKMLKIQTFCSTEVFSNWYIFNSVTWNHLWDANLVWLRQSWLSEGRVWWTVWRKLALFFVLASDFECSF